MPRPTAAQLAYGSATVIVSTIAMLLLSQTSTGLGVAVIAAAALALGLLVALTVPLPRPRGRHAASRTRTAPVYPGGPDTVQRDVAASAPAPVEHPVHH